MSEEGGREGGREGGSEWMREEGIGGREGSVDTKLVCKDCVLQPSLPVYSSQRQKGSLILVY